MSADENDRPSEKPSDEALASMARQGDRLALESLVRRYLRPVHAIARSYLRETADVEDAAQETFVRLCGGIEGYDPDRPFAPWLYQITRNVARARLAASRSRSMIRLDEVSLESSVVDPAVGAERAEIRSIVDIELSRLPEQRRMAFRLADIEGYSTSDIASLMDISEGTVRSHVHHARHALRSAVARRLGVRECSKGSE